MWVLRHSDMLIVSTRNYNKPALNSYTVDTIYTEIMCKILLMNFDPFIFDFYNH